jgi:hypothetical protein
MYASIMGAINMALVVILFAIMDRGRIVSPAYGRLGEREIRELRALRGRSSLATGAAE